MSAKSRLLKYIRAIGALASISAVVVVITDGAVEAQSVATSQPAAVPADDPARGLVYAGLERDTSGRCGNLLRVRGTDKCTHGPDAPPPGFSMGKHVQAEASSLAAASVDCIGDGSSGLRVQMMYVHPPGTNRYAEYLSSFQQWTSDMATIYSASAAQTGGTRKVRVVHNSACAPVILNVEISASALSSFGGTINALKALGYTRTDRKYAIFGDSTVYCGIGEFQGDDRKIASNRSNFGPSFGRTDRSCWGGHTVAHELGHNLGAVNNNAPNASGGAHCTDEYDVMCYSDSPNYPPMRIICTDRANENRMDCGKNDYFHTSPPANSYLATHYNVADNPFLDGSGTTPPPPTGTGPIVGLAGKCVDIQGASSADMTPLVIYTCHGGANQSWTVSSDGTLRSLGKCMDVRGGSTTAGTVVQLNTCNTGGAQKWVHRTDKTLQNPQSGKCLDVEGASSADGARLLIWTCHTGANQKWTLPV